MADNIEFRSDMADEGHIGEAVGLYEADKRIIHLSAPNVGNRSVPAADVADAERIFWDFVNKMKKFDEPAMNEPWL
jgi:hypothetical protein